ncbi:MULTISPECIES: hypothetical protein [Cryobacterium]|uniref:Uncharacterized protein n=1 Tax=Cryobacterium breve TaxID=1259258 RepID=A0ABY2IYR9_9MICO|nr:MULTISPECIES: hypothetical protein [Cryobacterium]TFC93934.1 hypothetical protein E3T20_09295 [Cryobacterium sp. TmT3-12]TFC95678.1 hypothetical protein E3O65_14375 [Cryobacterium breve]
MDYVIASLFGLSIGTLFAYSAYPVVQRLPLAAVMVIVLVGAWVVIWGPVASSSGLGIIIGLTSVIGLALAGANRWAAHPLLANSGYWSRVVLWMTHSRTLRLKLPEE